MRASNEWAQAHGHEVLCHIRDAQTAAVDFVHGEGLLMAPTIAVPEMLKRNGLSLQDFDLYEIHEAFAAQVLCTLRAWESERSEEHTSELQSLMRISYAVFCLKKKR